MSEGPAFALTPCLPHHLLALELGGAMPKLPLSCCYLGIQGHGAGRGTLPQAAGPDVSVALQ